MIIPLILTLITQISAPPYIRPEADIERRTVFVEFVYDGDTFRGIRVDDDMDVSSSRARQDAAFARDGDTFKGLDGVDYRLSGINAPEVAHPEHDKPEGQPGGEESSDALKRMILGERVTVLVDRANPTDRYGRTVAVVLMDDRDVNLDQVRNGFAEIRYVDLSPMIDEAIFRQYADDRAPGGGMEMPAASNREAGDRAESGALVNPNAAAHVLEAGDRVRLIVGPQSENFTVNPDGEILIKGLGVIRIGGKTAAQATTDLDSAIRAKGITATPITVFYLAPPTRTRRNVMIMGAIRRTGTYPATTILGAISTADGFTNEANPTEIRVTLNETTTIVNAARIMGGVDKDIDLQGGEVIIVPSFPRILVSGAVARPTWITAQYLSEAISVAGGPLPEADLERVELRTQSDTPIRIDAQAIFSGRIDDIRLNDRDRITIPIKPRAVVPNIQVYGPVLLPGTRQGFTVADAVREARPDTRADLQNVIIDRGNGDTTTVNARDIALGHALDQDLKTGDRVLIPRRPEAADTLQTVVVLGDVASPGQVPPGTLTQTLARAGGPKPTARLNAIHVRQPDGQAQTYDLTRLTTGRLPDPNLPPNSTVYVESDEPRRQGLADLRVIIGIVSALLLFAAK
jgi:protein involved in polysaccharide export with SLBB domain/endonuclease YncB( thermonuclease family)